MSKFQVLVIVGEITSSKLAVVFDRLEDAAAAASLAALVAGGPIDHLNYWKDHWYDLCELRTWTNNAVSVYVEIRRLPEAKE